MNQPKFVFHLVYRLGIGGLETLLINMINNMSDEKYRHKIICLTNSEGLESRLNKAVEIIELNKKNGNDLSLHFKLASLFRRDKPQILHTYNIPTIEYHFTAWLMGVKGRLHAEHGRDASDPLGKNKKYNFLRKILSPFIQCYVAVSDDLNNWLLNDLRLSNRKVKLILNGVDTNDFNPVATKGTDKAIIQLGIIGRLDPVKDHKTLFDAIQKLKDKHKKLKLSVIGDGSERQKLEEYVHQIHLEEEIAFLGAKNDIAEQLKDLDVFILSSIAEGIPITLIEAMSCGLPTVTTDVGGIPEVVLDNQTGILVSPKQAEQMADALLKYIDHPNLRLKHGKAGRKRIIDHFSLDVMVENYTNLYNDLTTNN